MNLVTLVGQTVRGAARVRKRLSRLLERLGLLRKLERGCFGGSRQIDHLEMHIDKGQMCVFVADKKVRRVHELAKRFLLIVQRNQRLVPENQIRWFFSVFISVTLALPLPLTYPRSLFFDMAGTRLRKGNGRIRHLVRLSCR